MKNDTKQVLEALGVVAIVVSLIFVGVQLFLDRRIAESERYENRAESRMANVRALLESDAYMQRQEKLWDMGTRPRWWNAELEAMQAESGLSGSDVWAEIFSFQLSIEVYDSLYFQYEQGLMPENYWTGAQNVLREELEDPMRRAFYLGTPRPVLTIVRELLEEIDNE